MLFLRSASGRCHPHQASSYTYIARVLGRPPSTAAPQMFGEPARPIKQGLAKLKAQVHTNQDVYYPLRQPFFDVVRMEQRTTPYDEFR